MLLGLAILLFSPPAVLEAAQASAVRTAPVVLAAAAETPESGTKARGNIPVPTAGLISPSTPPLTGISLTSRHDLALIPDLSTRRVPPGTTRSGPASESFPGFTHDAPSSRVPATLPNSNATPPIQATKVSPARLGREHAHPPKTWWALAAVSHGAAAFDAWTTRQAISHGKGRELDPFLKPFADNASLYVAIQVSPAVVDYVGKRLLTSHHAWMRKMWWVPQLIGAFVSMSCGIHNLDVLHRPGFPQ